MTTFEITSRLGGSAPWKSPTPVGAALAPLEGLVRVWTIDLVSDAWILYDPSVVGVIPERYFITELVHGQTYWILLSTSQIVSLGTAQYDLVAGWNHIRWEG